MKKKMIISILVVVIILLGFGVKQVFFDTSKSSNVTAYVNTGVPRNARGSGVALMNNLLVS